MGPFFISISCYYNSMQKILIIINLVVVLAAAAVVFYSHNILAPPPTDQTGEAEKMKSQALRHAQIRPVALKKIVVNLHSGGTRLRYLDVDMNILTFHEDQKELVTSSQHIIKDSVIEVGAQLSPDELDTVTGKILFEKRLKDRVNSKLREVNAGMEQPVVKQIFFSGFVVQ
jgi:flagellar protein FliL